MSSESEPPDLQKAATFFQYGTDAAHKSNFDYAIDMYKQACKIVPDNLVYRQALRGIERRKFNNDPNKVGMLAGAKNQPILMRARAARGKSHFRQAIEHSEDAFVNNPWDVGAARVAAEAAEGLGYMVLAQWFVESVQAVTKDVDFLKYGARVYEANESWQKAIACWEQIKKIHPNDQDVARQINALMASSTINRAGLDEALDKHAEAAKIGEPTESMDAKLERLKQEQLTPEQRLVKEILSDPTATHAYLDLADLYRHRSEFDKAEKILAKGLKANPNEQSLRAAHEDTQMSRLKRAIESQTQRVLQHPEDTGAKAKLDQFTEMFNKYEVEAFKRRVSLHPEDPKMHFELGLVLARTGAHDEAIAEFQAARSSPVYKIQALYQAGLSFEANGALKLAYRSYKEALKIIEADDKEMFKALNYRAGRVSEGLANTEAAEEHYNEVANVDYGYLDVADRLKRLN
jgi:tetratricopeptide (TPR) repeat protein